MVGNNAGNNAKSDATESASAGAKTFAKIGARIGIGAARPGGLAGWLLGWLRGRMQGARKPAPRLQLVERITLGPRQTLALVEAEGRRVLVATSPEGAPAFYAVDGAMSVKFGRRAAPGRARTSW
jgi:flagellar biogenesis protein FliO